MVGKSNHLTAKNMDFCFPSNVNRDLPWRMSTCRRETCRGGDPAAAAGERARGREGERARGGLQGDPRLLPLHVCFGSPPQNLGRSKSGSSKHGNMVFFFLGWFMWFWKSGPPAAFWHISSQEKWPVREHFISPFRSLSESL